MAALTTGCASSDPIDYEVEVELAKLGIEPTTIARTGNSIVVDDDIIFEQDALLAGEYTPAEPVDTHGYIVKGYRRSSRVSAANVANMKLVWGTGSEAPTAAMKTAFINAAAAWSAIPNSALRLSTTNTGPTITVRKVSTFSWPPLAAPDCTSTSACANYPSNNRPGANIYIESTPTGLGCISWSTSMLDAVARHEIGHAVGFTHPKEASSQHVADTGVCNSNESTCFNNPGYTTIMSKVLVGNCVALSPRLTQDDYATTAATY